MRTLACGIALFVGGFIVTAIGVHYLRLATPEPVLQYRILPHQEPKFPGAATFRFAMVHDVVHERFPKHGPAYYIERERLARERLTHVSPDSDDAFGLMDDIAAGLDRLGKPAEAVPIMRDKLARQQVRGLTGLDLYTTHANLGTFLVHTHMKGAIARSPTDLERVREGREFVAQSIKLNPNAHFGREEWQLVAIDTFLEYSIRPELVKEFDLIGNSLSAKVNEEVAGKQVAISFTTARPFKRQWSEMGYRKERSGVREVGKDDRIGKQAPFDEPCLGIIGMWRQGGGANPYFALCLGEIMIRVGQRFIAWACYERAFRLADRFWPEKDKQDFLRGHCRLRQKAIEETMNEAELSQLRPRFDAELAKGLENQKDYQAYEAKRIAEGVSIHSPTFFDEFHATHPNIASRPGPEEWHASERFSYARYFERVFAIGLLGGGLFVFVASLIRTRRRSASTGS